jgi:hypothetical protein
MGEGTMGRRERVEVGRLVPSTQEQDAFPLFCFIFLFFSNLIFQVSISYVNFKCEFQVPF